MHSGSRPLSFSLPLFSYDRWGGIEAIVLVVPYRPAVLLAKLVSTLDGVSNGRLTQAGFNHLSVGFPWREPAEYLEKMAWFADRVMPAFAQE